MTGVKIKSQREIVGNKELGSAHEPLNHSAQGLSEYDDEETTGGQGEELKRIGEECLQLTQDNKQFLFTQAR